MLGLRYIEILYIFQNLFGKMLRQEYCQQKFKTHNNRNGKYKLIDQANKIIKSAISMGYSVYSPI